MRIFLKNFAGVIWIGAPYVAKGSFRTPKYTLQNAMTNTNTSPCVGNTEAENTFSFINLHTQI